MRSKIEDYTLTLLKSSCKIRVSKGDKEWEYTCKRFEREGMKIFPKPLYKLITSELKYANIYDKFLEKYYTWCDEEE
jgi:hypothetical protein